MTNPPDKSIGDARARKRRQRWLRRRLEAIPAWVGLGFLPVLQRLPLRAVEPVGNALGSLAHRVWSRPARVARENLTAAFPEKIAEEIEALIARCFRNWGVFVLEMLRAPLISDEEWKDRITVVGREHLDAGLAKGRGVLIASGHFGPFETGVACLAWHGYPAAVIVRYASTSALTERLSQVRETAGYETFSYSQRGFRALRKLRANQTVCLLIDQDTRGYSIFTTFFGRPAATGPGAAVMAARSGAALIGAWVIREPGGHLTIVLDPPIYVPPDDPDAVQAAMQRLTSRLEEMVRQHPDHWLWMHRRWKTRPPAPGEDLRAWRDAANA